MTGNQAKAAFMGAVTPCLSKEISMTLLNDIHHLAFITADMDRLIGFYERVFEAEVTMDLTEDNLRHVFIQIGPHTVLHPFEIPGHNPPADSQPRFNRGRLDHFALNAASEEAFIEIYRRLKAEGVHIGEVVDMGAILLFTFCDPDNGEQEVAWIKPGQHDENSLLRKNWTTVDLLPA
jgi:catechol 2,3-dioxygenase-like lactoylglutathione lyase family enzyme